MVNDMRIKREISKEINSERNLDAELKKILNGIPTGRLTVRKSRSSKYYTAHFAEGRQYIGNPKKLRNHKANVLIQNLSIRFYAEKMREIIKNNIIQLEKALCRIKDYDPNNLLDKAPEAYQIIGTEEFERLGFPDHRAFENECNGSSEHYYNSFRDGDKTHVTATGIKVRSRAEVAIADTYTLKGLEYRYEEPLILPDGTVLHPDFTIFVPSLRKDIYHEFAGMLSKQEYCSSFIWKEQKYIEYGMYPNRDYFVTCEERDGSIDMEKLGTIIDDFLR